jgi:hypothetical protein
MTSPVRSAAVVTVLATAFTLALCGVAGARAGDRSFQQTFPDASQLCVRVSANTEGSRLRRAAPRVLADCSRLQTRFGAAQSAVLAARAAIMPALLADRAALSAACPRGTKPLCGGAERMDGPAIAALSQQLHAAARVYYRAIELARERFWDAIHALPGGRRLRADVPIAILPD